MQNDCMKKVNVKCIIDTETCKLNKLLLRLFG